MTGKDITRFYEAHSRRLYNMSRRILQSGEDAEEVMHDTILKYLSFRPKGFSEEQTSAWLARTCIRASVDRLRKKKREALFLEEYAHELSAAEETPIPGEIDAGRILAALEKLPDHYRLVTTLILVEGLDYEETALYTGQKESTLRSRYLRGRQKLAALLKDGKQI